MQTDTRDICNRGLKRIDTGFYFEKCLFSVVKGGKVNVAEGANEVASHLKAIIQCHASTTIKILHFILNQSEPLPLNAHKMPPLKDHSTQLI